MIDLQNFYWKSH